MVRTISRINKKQNYGTKSPKNVLKINDNNDIKIMDLSVIIISVVPLLIWTV